ncbi:hypothetical protein RRG08_033377 [Elysia crispata]|uniref:Uncharacterized protein n=1 Tax=Elysia crispata TaxID=231223 RepID=A0AAE0YZJ2_9GAST|nr:hypothetical protein RRG08_033377 [Elysia crispata]
MLFSKKDLPPRILIAFDNLYILRQQTMNSLSKSMRTVRLDQQNVAIETAANMLAEAYDTAGCPTLQDQTERDAEASLNDISFTELVPVTGLDNNIIIDVPDLANGVDSFSCYLPPVNTKGDILPNGNLVANTALSTASD